MLNTTVGQLLVNEALPEDLRDYNRVLDKKGMGALLQQVARQYPEKYREVSFQLSQVGQRSAQDQGGMSFGMRHLKRSKIANETRKRIQGHLDNILSDDSLTDQQRNDLIVKTVGRESEPQQKAVLEEAIQAKNPLAMQVLSGSRGKPMNLASLLAADMLYSDHRDEVIPIPVLRSYSEGLSPEEYWAGTYGARRGIIATKFATQEAGFLSKQLNQAGHRLVVMGEEGDEDPEAPTRGLVVDTDDMDNEGSLLARDVGPYKRNTPLTPKILKQLQRLGKNRILVRSPMVGGSPEGGVYARDVGIREHGTLAGLGEQVGLQAAQALSEPISQGQLSAKHSGGVAGQEKAVGGFQYINQLIQTPKKMQGGAAHSTLDGTVQRVEPAAAGGFNVTIDGKPHYVGEGFGVKVKKGDNVEAGDVLSDGIPNPAVITQYKGVGEGRRYFVNEFRKAMAASGMQGHRRNIELLARGLINHVKLTEETDDHAPDDIVPYSTLEHTYKPREGHERLTPKKALGQYLERPVLHYTIGTKIRPSMLRDFDDFGVQAIPVHKNPPPFEPHMVRGMYQMQHDPDWMTQMYGSGLKKSLLESTARGATSEERGTSFIPSLASGTDFGEVPDRAVIQPKPAYSLPKVSIPDVEPENSGSTFFGGRYKVGMQKRAVEATPPKVEAPASTSMSAPTAPTPSPSNAAELGSNNIMSPATTVQPKLDTVTQPIQPPADIPQASQTPRASQPPQASQPPPLALEDEKLNEWNRIHSYDGFKYQPRKRMPNGERMQVFNEATERKIWQLHQEKAYKDKYKELPAEIKRNKQEMNDAMDNFKPPGVEPLDSGISPRSTIAATPTQSVPPSTPAQAKTDAVQASRSRPPTPIQPPLPQVKTPAPKMPELSTGTAATSRLTSSRLGSQTAGIPWWRATAKPTDTTWNKTENTEFHSQPNSVLGATPSVAMLAGATSDAATAAQPKPPEVKPPDVGYVQQAIDAFKSNGSGLYDLGLGGAVATAIQKFAPGTAAKAIPAATRIGRAGQMARNVLLPGVAGASLPVAALATAGTYAATSAAGEVLDAVGLRPEWAGGDGWGNLGWDQSKFNQETMSDEGGYWSQVAQMKGFTDPLKSVYAIGEGGLEGANWLYNKFRGGAK
jgi:hypothetical protein